MFCEYSFFASLGLVSGQANTLYFSDFDPKYCPAPILNTIFNVKIQFFFIFRYYLATSRKERRRHRFESHCDHVSKINEAILKADPPYPKVATSIHKVRRGPCVDYVYKSFTIAGFVKARTIDNFTQHFLF